MPGPVDELLATTAMAIGGAAVAREPDGRVVFVDGALAGERVRAEILSSRRRFAKARLVEVLDPSPDRREAPCEHRRAGCGGCAWQEIRPAAQLRYERDAVHDALTRLGGLAEPRVEPGPVLSVRGHRTTLRCIVSDGRAGYRRARTHEALTVDSCLVAHPLLAELLAEGRFDGCREVTLRAGARTGERLVVATPRADGVVVPPDVVVVGRDELDRGRRAWFHEEVAGRTWRISASSFFQSRPDGAEALVDLVAGEVAEQLASDDRAAAPAGGGRTLVDLCCGVGLFAGALGARAELSGWRVLGVERHGPAVVDARRNLADAPVPTRVVRTGMADWSPRPAEIVVADPPRSGLGAAGVRSVAATGASLVVLVSCDPASLGRDAALLARAGYTPRRTTLVDLFPQTPHVETVTSFVRSPP